MNSMSISIKRDARHGITQKHIESLHQVWGWLAEAGDEYKEQAEILRDIRHILQKIVDIENGIEQGYLSEEVESKRREAIKDILGIVFYDVYASSGLITSDERIEDIADKIIAVDKGA